MYHAPVTAADYIDALRWRQQRNFIASLLVSQGVPMLQAGDELVIGSGGAVGGSGGAGTGGVVVTPIADIKQNDAQGVPLLLGALQPDG